MFNSKSDYALNKRDPDSIVCQSATGVNIRLTREDFTSEEEFLHWKIWSDTDYHEIQLAGREDDDCLPFSESLDYTCSSAEDDLLNPIMETKAAVQRAVRTKRVREILTKGQYRRLCMRYIDNLTVEEIAALEGVSFQAISINLRKAERAIMNKLKTF